MDFDRIGGHPNAFTSHDRTFYHGVTRAADIDKQIEILADMMRSTLPVDEFHMEKNVVLEEIAMSNDRIEHVAFDMIIEKVFEGNSLGWPVLGYEKTINKLTRDQMHEYFQTRYTSDNLILVVTGNVDPEEAVKIATKYCGDWTPSGKLPARIAPEIKTGVAKKTAERFSQQVISMTFAAPGGPDPMHETAEAVATILGGPNSRFFWNIEQKGLCSHAGAYRLDFADCGLLILLGLCDPANGEQVTELMRSEAIRMSKEPVKDSELQRVKNKRRTSVAVEGESPHHRLNQVMDDVDYRGEPRTVEDRLRAVDAINQDSILKYFERFPIEKSRTAGNRWSQVSLLYITTWIPS